MKKICLNNFFSIDREESDATDTNESKEDLDNSAGMDKRGVDVGKTLTETLVSHSVVHNVMKRDDKVNPYHKTDKKKRSKHGKNQ